MSDAPAIRVEGLSKKYRVRAKHETGSRRKEDFWALRDVSFEVPAGEVLGVVGRNGAGKSTLLKILSRIVQPTSGQALLRGRLAGLLEVGTGFNPELTGRENIYLNGTILGMSRRDVQRRFESIVDFAGVSYFLDTPIKRYSSGMYVRLAFAVAAHLDAEILILDEVLAVGDLAFQRKCLAKVHDLVQDGGRTVLLVSHNAAVIREHATSAIRLESGLLTLQGSPERVLSEDDHAVLPSSAELGDASRADPNWGQVARIVSATIAGGGRLTLGQDLVYSLTFDTRHEVDLGVGQAVTAPDDSPIAASFGKLRPYGPGRHTVGVCIPRPPLAPGAYALNLVVGQASFEAPDLHFDGVLRAVGFEVVDPDHRIDWHPEWWGRVILADPVVERNDADG